MKSFVCVFFLSILSFLETKRRIFSLAFNTSHHSFVYLFLNFSKLLLTCSGTFKSIDKINTWERILFLQVFDYFCWVFITFPFSSLYFSIVLLVRFLLLSLPLFHSMCYHLHRFIFRWKTKRGKCLCKIDFTFKFRRKFLFCFCTIVITEKSMKIFKFGLLFAFLSLGLKWVDWE